MGKRKKKEYNGIDLYSLVLSSDSINIKSASAFPNELKTSYGIASVSFNESSERLTVEGKFSGSTLDSFIEALRECGFNIAQMRGSVILYLEEKLNNLAKENPDYSNKLMGELMLWGASIPREDGTDLRIKLIQQIVYQAGVHDMDIKKYIDYLFEQETPDKWMKALQD